MSAFLDPRDVSSGLVLDKYMSIEVAVEYSGYNAQYFRKLMRKSAVKDVKVGQESPPLKPTGPLFTILVTDVMSRAFFM